MAVVVTQPERESFRRCRRQWDLQARMRRNLEPVARPGGPDLPAALHAALAVYYFPGMWDWDRAVTMPLVRQGLDRELARQQERGASALGSSGWPRARAVGQDLLSRYTAWAPGVDTFSPVLIEADYEVQVPDPARPGGGLTAAGGQPVRFGGRIHMLAVDEHDAYWLVRHTALTGDGPEPGELAAEEAALADAWAWEQFYPGLTITGTIGNEIRLSGGATDQAEQVGPGWQAQQIDPASQAGPDRPRGLLRGRRRRGPRSPGALSARAGSAGPEAPGPKSPGPKSPGPGSALPLVRQHEPSGGGRSIPHHRRLYAKAREPAAAAKIEQVTDGPFRRTWIRHSPEEIAAAGLRLAADAGAMVAAGRSAPPNPSDANCRPCAFGQPCLAMRAGRDSEFLLRSGFRTRPPDILEEGRLGGGAWGLGRGAAPFRRG